MKLSSAICLLLGAVCWTGVAYAATPQRIRSADINRILNNDRILTTYIKCLLDNGPCAPDGRELKNLLPDALATGCSRCSEQQRYLAERVIKHLMAKRSNDWTLLKAKYDPKGEYERRLAKSKMAPKPMESTVKTTTGATVKTTKTSSATSKSTPTASSKSTPTVTSRSTPSATSKSTPSAASKSTPSSTSKSTPTVTSRSTPSATSKSTPSATSKTIPNATPGVAPKGTHKTASKTVPKPSPTSSSVPPASS